MPEAFPPGATLGILGGGQLGRMLAMAAARLGFRTHVWEPGPEAPAAEVAAAATRASWDDPAALAAFAAGVDVVTTEFENVPLATLRALEALRPVRPAAAAVAVAQDRLAEKTFLAGLGLGTAPFAAIDAAADIGPALARLGGAGLLKTRRLGYDGKGQVRVADAGGAAAAWEAIGRVPAILEGIVPFGLEISVIAARGLSGAVVAFDPPENRHEGGILRTSRVPAAIPRRTAEAAVQAAGRILAALDYVGVIGVEFFVAGPGLLVNEIAPRVHNTGHWTLEACVTSQFEQHVRAVMGWPPGDPARHSDAVMTNLIGAEAADWARLAADPGAALHLYGKREARPGRKMGHVTRLSRRG